MLDTPLVRGERGGLAEAEVGGLTGAEVGGLRLDMVRNKDGRTMTGTSYLYYKPSRVQYLVSRLQAQGTECNITHYIH
jgi:hypothetical protein